MIAAKSGEEQENVREMAGIEYAYVAEEFNRLLAGKHLQKFQKIRDDVYRLRFEKFDVVCELGLRMHITKYLEESEEADAFVQKARKEVVGRRLSEVRQLNRDRILQFFFEGGLSLVFELFKKGNIVILKENGILGVLREGRWGRRELKRGAVYLTPPPPPQKLEEVLDEKPIITSLIRLSFGKEYARELLLRAGINENTAANSLAADVVERLKKEMNFAPEPQLFVLGGKAVGFGLISFAGHGKAKVEKTETLSEAADRFYFENRREEALPGLKKLEVRLEKQQQYLCQLKKEEECFREMANWFYANYAYAEELINEARKLGMQNLEKLKEKESKIKEVNKEKKIIELEI